LGELMNRGFEVQGGKVRYSFDAYGIHLIGIKFG